MLKAQVSLGSNDFTVMNSNEVLIVKILFDLGSLFLKVGLLGLLSLAEALLETSLLLGLIRLGVGE
jgi:hypothetical protein